MGNRTEVVLGSYYLHWGVIQLSLTNFLIIVAMLVLFVVALLAPFPGGSDRDERPAHRGEGGSDGND